MTEAARSAFTYSIFIRATPQAVWSALTDPEQTKIYWFGFRSQSDWRPGSSWTLCFPDGRVADTGEVAEAVFPSRLVLKWRNEFKPELRAEGYSTCAFDIETEGGATHLKVTHDIAGVDSPFIKGVSWGWPRILSNLKSLLETGEIAVVHETN